MWRLGLSSLRLFLCPVDYELVQGGCKMMKLWCLTVCRGESQILLHGKACARSMSNGSFASNMQRMTQLCPKQHYGVWMSMPCLLLEFAAAIYSTSQWSLNVDHVPVYSVWMECVQVDGGHVQHPR